MYNTNIANKISPKKISVLLDNIRSIYNVGSIFRTSDAAGINKIYLCGISATPEHPKLVKTALGADKSVEWEYNISAFDTVKRLKSIGHTIYSVELTEGAIDFRTAEYPDGTVLVFGHEVDGVDKDILAISDKVIMIPMLGIKESLNVATSYGIVAYEALRDSIK